MRTCAFTLQLYKILSKYLLITSILNNHLQKLLYCYIDSRHKLSSIKTEKLMVNMVDFDEKSPFVLYLSFCV